jgi:predicted GIY-YIG superfamily endonuclease
MASIPFPYPHVKGYTYILASKKGGTLYCGVTTDLPRRIWEHREGTTGGFTARYGVKRLVWYEEFPWAIDAIKRAKAHQDMAEGLEGQADRGAEPAMARSLFASSDVLIHPSRRRNGWQGQALP